MKRNSAILIGILIAVALAAVLVSAQQQPTQTPQPGDQQASPRPPHPPMDPMGEMFPPEMIMQHQRELGLTDEQKTFMRSEINKTSTRFNELQWQLQDAMEALHDTMKANVVDEQQALAQLNRVLDGEREIKTLHLQLAIRIKNKLTPEQQEKLRAMHHGPGHGPDGPGPGQGPAAPFGFGSPPPGSPRPREGTPKPDNPTPKSFLW